jgi:parallel beta-helix repeat protein
LDAGSIVSSTSTTITDTNALWGAVTSARLTQYPGEVVVLLSGAATGQFRTIQSINTNTKTITLSQPWSPVPAAGDLYSIFSWTFSNATITGNTLIDNPNGIVLYDGCYVCTVQNNTLTNSRGIILRTADELLNQSLYPEGRRFHEVAINDNILENTVSDTSGVRPAYIALDTEAFAPNSYNGMGMINIQVGANIINPYTTNPSLTYPPGATEITQEGFFPCFLFGPAAVKPPVTTVFQSINFWNNSQSPPVTYSQNLLPYTTKACVALSAPAPNAP